MTINTARPKPLTPEVSFTHDDNGDPFSYVVNGNVYISGAYVELNTPVEFTATVRNVVPVEYFWNFGDGETGYGNPITHIFTTLNTHQRVSLRVTDTNGRRYHIVKQLHLIDSGDGAPVFQASETDIAQPIKINPRRRRLTQPVETDTAQPITGILSSQTTYGAGTYGSGTYGT